MPTCTWKRFAEVRAWPTSRIVAWESRIGEEAGRLTGSAGTVDDLVSVVRGLLSSREEGSDPFGIRPSWFDQHDGVVEAGFRTAVEQLAGGSEVVPPGQRDGAHDRPSATGGPVPSWAAMIWSAVRR